MKHRSFALLLASAAFVLTAAAAVPAWAQNSPAPKAAPDNPAALPDQEVGRRFTIKAEDLPPPKTGPIASSLEAFRVYHEESAWTWEHMALTRARAVAGPEALRRRVMDEVRAVLIRKRDPAKLAAEVADMRLRIAAAHRKPPAFEVKHRRGGMVDIEFIAQYLQLRDAWRTPQALRQNTREALRALADARTEAEDARVNAVVAHARMLAALRRVDRLGSVADSGDPHSRVIGEVGTGVAHALDGLDRADLASNGPPTAENRGSEQQ